MKPTQHTVNTPYLVGPVHCYTAVCDGELVLFDTGPPTGDGRRYLRDHIDLPNLRHVVVTHCHIDHYGLLSWLEQETDAAIYLPYRDTLKIVYHDERMGQLNAVLRGVGFDTAFLDDLGQVLASGVLFPPYPQQYLVAEESIPARLGIEAVPCPGHSQSDLVFVLGDYAVTGDTLLRGIFQSPLLDIDLETGKRFNNYEAYCASIVRLAGLQGKTILPGHRQTIDGVKDVLLFYVTKMLLRVEQLLPYRNETNISAIIRRLFGDTMKDPFHIYLKASEILFMKDFLQDPARLESSLRQIELYAAVEEQFRRVTS
jgi:hydroxyacylglutathione hydrolase